MTNPRSHRILSISIPASAFFAISFLLASLFLPSGLLAQQAPPQQVSPQELVRSAIQNRMKDDSRLHLLIMERTQSTRDTTLRSKNSSALPAASSAGSCSSMANRSIPPSKARKSSASRRCSNPDQIQRKQKEQQADTERTDKMLATLPDAFNFTYRSAVTAPNGHQLVHLSSPQCQLYPPSRESAVFTGMQGEMVIDETAQRLAKIDGTLFKDVNFGWGILRQTLPRRPLRCRTSRGHTRALGDHSNDPALRWEGALFNPSTLMRTRTFWGFQRVPPMSVEQARGFLTSSSSRPECNDRSIIGMERLERRLAARPSRLACQSTHIIITPQTNSFPAPLYPTSPVSPQPHRYSAKIPTASDPVTQPFAPGRTSG